VITVGTDQVRSYDKEGKLLWHFGGMSSIAIPQPFSEYGLLYVSSGYIGDQVRPVYAIKPGAEGDITLEEDQQSNQWVVWYQPQAGSYNPTPLIYRDRFYTLLDRGFFTAHDPKTGAEVYGKQRIERGSVLSRPRPGRTTARSSCSARTATRSSSKPATSSRSWARTRSTRCACRRPP